ncbi:hypothetical protein PGT21_034013 [Puccinia graminis f. sp. tritici]|uniref:Uncharacterized protein n=1 Tax=Puccinia graminis f. sp. tritici TaxID=56615 RepID=A0A5B0M9D1_PUCGR|nr:hypothetical protein PGT21_034013 [Puccinia graminis f. sp. tritici]
MINLMPYNAELRGLAGRLLSRIGDCCGTIKAKMIQDDPHRFWIKAMKYCRDEHDYESWALPSDQTRNQIQQRS